MPHRSYRLPCLFVILGQLAVACSETSDAASRPASIGTGGAVGLGESGGDASATLEGNGLADGGTESQGGAASSGTSAAFGGGVSASNPAKGGAAAGGSLGVGGSGSGGTTSPRVGCQPPANYRNLFAEILGKNPEEVDGKVTNAVQQLFHGNVDEEAIYYELGTDQAQIKDIGNNDVRSEGQSYGMLVAVQMNMKTEFDKLWKYAATCMRQPNGLFAWQMKPGACSAISTGAAPDGDEYFAMALMLASRRWGDTTGTDYAGEAKKALKAIATQGDFKTSPAVVTFGPYMPFSDPSYVLPLFYSEWACFDAANATLWSNATSYARTFFQKVTDPTTGLAPYQVNFDGTPVSNTNNTNFNADAWRVPMNIMMDFNLNNADSWQATYAARMAAFWLKEGIDDYGSGYTLSGTLTSGNGHGQGLTGVNAMLAFAIPQANGKAFLQAAWDVGTPTGGGRYYDGTLYLLSMLHLSGKFRLFF